MIDGCLNEVAIINHGATAQPSPYAALRKLTCISINHGATAQPSPYAALRKLTCISIQKTNGALTIHPYTCTPDTRSGLSYNGTMKQKAILKTILQKVAVRTGCGNTTMTLLLKMMSLKNVHFNVKDF
ncbi:hypothetical protein QE152_g34145 [Popillia japonica]|uniref:Uncharacterized protein n=1 Tax=Popillia japonica TaxID=7064 RepID=A0AAW1IUF4_POPJA